MGIDYHWVGRFGNKQKFKKQNRKNFLVNALMNQIIDHSDY